MIVFVSSTPSSNFHPYGIPLAIGVANGICAPGWLARAGGVVGRDLKASHASKDRWRQRSTDIQQ